MPDRARTPTPPSLRPSSRRQALRALAALTLAPTAARAASEPEPTPLPARTGPGPSPFFGSIGPLVTLPQKAPLILVTDRPVQLETPRTYFLSALTPNAAMFVRWHLDGHPREIDLSTYRLQVEGHVERPLSLSLTELCQRFPTSRVVAVNQCSGNSRSRFQPRVPGGQWGHGAMGCAEWTGVRLKDVLAAAGIKKGAVAVQLEGLERGPGPEGKGAHRYQKSLALAGDLLDEALLVHSMNGEPLPLLNGFPLRVVVPGYFSTYWVKALGCVRVLDRPDESYWMKTAYLVPDTKDHGTTPEEAASGKLRKVPIGRMPVRSFLITPDGGSKLLPRVPVALKGIAFSGRERITRIEWSADGGASWQPARLGEDLGRHAFRTFRAEFVPPRPGRYLFAVRATDGSGATQSDVPRWNPGGYEWNVIEQQPVIVGESA
ncbi:MAG: molybdopterin-dependent oxidoreductase [Polyangia bacterium]